MKRMELYKFYCALEGVKKLGPIHSKIWTLFKSIHQSHA